ncbi:uncharacterized protein TA16415 [Theileria annulata]|uniref:RNA polymerase II subunit B1 CTD phosphatase RPAP2 homolog n=1 Tax=Theileria annulata TaxID=5874 RepID=Q4UIV9_THEAN|nr:uncharacterized protein TA16415 [Theileria annulata]CAI72980.1 hypothetical protein, conserved [Theileria annulata]|eukprot:XP_953658.1 hypothetical protein, conserved [Theileria annulata]
MVQSAGTVHFDQSEPLVFYYESFEHNYPETGSNNNNNNINKKSFIKQNFENEGDLTFVDPYSDLESQQVYDQKSYNYRDSTDPSNKQDLNETFSSVYNTDDNHSPVFISTGSSSVVPDPDASLKNGVKSENSPKKETNGTEPVSEEKVTNATYFYKILFHLIDIASDGSRFKCCKKSMVNPCEPCKVVEKLIYTYFDLTTLEDVIAERSKNGICGYIYCCNQIKKSTGESKYKIDVASNSIYEREECDSFCSTNCLDDNEKVNAKVSLSPVELGTFTPRAMRNANNESLKKLYENVFSLRKCFGLPKNFNVNNIVTASTIDLGTQGPNSQDTDTKHKESDQMVLDTNKDEENKNKSKFDGESKKPKDDKRQRIDTFEIFEDFDSADEMTEPPMSEANVKFYKNPEKLVSIYKPSPYNTDLADNTTSTRSFDQESLDLSESEDFPEDEYLGIFSWLWYVLSNFITNKTRDFLNSGIISQNRHNENFDDLYKQCLKGIPNNLLDTLKTHIQNILSTFKPAKNNLLNTKIIEPLAYTIKYVILKNRHHLPLNYNSNLSNNSNEASTNQPQQDQIVFEEPEQNNNIICNEELKEADYQIMLQDVNNVLNNRFLLDQESIDILSELFLEP